MPVTSGVPQGSVLGLVLFQHFHGRLQPFNQFLLHQTVRPSNPYFSNLERRKLARDCIEGFTEFQIVHIHILSSQQKS